MKEKRTPQHAVASKLFARHSFALRVAKHELVVHTNTNENISQTCRLTSRRRSISSCRSFPRSHRRGKQEEKISILLVVVVVIVVVGGHKSSLS